MEPMQDRLSNNQRLRLEALSQAVNVCAIRASGGVGRQLMASDEQIMHTAESFVGWIGGDDNQPEEGQA